MMVHDEERRAGLAAVVEKRGFQVAARTEGEMSQILSHEAPDAVVLDMDRSASHGADSLLELREDRLHTGLPVLVLTYDGMSDEEREMVAELATVHVPAADAEAALVRMLDVSFPVRFQEVDG